MTWKKGIRLLQLSAKGREKKMRRFVLSFAGILLLLLGTLFYGNQLWFGADSYINTSGQMEKYRQVQMDEDREQIRKLKPLYNFTVKRGDSSSTVILELKNYKDRDAIIAEIEQRGGQVYFDDRTESEIQFYKSAKKAVLGVLILMIFAAFALSAIEMSRSISERNREIALWMVSGYTGKQIAGLLWMQIFGLIFLSFLGSCLIGAVLNRALLCVLEKQFGQTDLFMGENALFWLAAAGVLAVLALTVFVNLRWKLRGIQPRDMFVKEL